MAFSAGSIMAQQAGQLVVEAMIITHRALSVIYPFSIGLFMSVQLDLC